jgi:hypothetical protein
MVSCSIFDVEKRRAAYTAATLQKDMYSLEITGVNQASGVVLNLFIYLFVIELLGAGLSIRRDETVKISRK